MVTFTRRARARAERTQNLATRIPHGTAEFIKSRIRERILFCRRCGDLLGLAKSLRDIADPAFIHPTSYINQEKDLAMLLRTVTRGPDIHTQWTPRVYTDNIASPDSEDEAN